MGTLDAHPRSAVKALFGVVLVWSVVAFALPRTDAEPFAGAPAGTRIGPMDLLAAIASDRPTTTLDAKRSEHPKAIPAMVLVEAGTRAALLWVIGDQRALASLVATAPLAFGMVRRGPPLLSTT